MKPTIKIQKIRENAIIPNKAEDDAGYDCFISKFNRIAYSESNDGKWIEKDLKPYEFTTIKLEPQQRIACLLGFKTEIPKGYYCEIVPRSGNSLWKGLTITNSPGTIDNSYRGEWIAIVHNTGLWTQKIKVGDKICQFIVKEMVDAVLEEVDGFYFGLEKSERGEGGFGSTGR